MITTCNIPAWLGIGHSIIITSIHNLAPTGLCDTVIIIRQHSLDRHATPKPANFGSVPRSTFGELCVHHDVDQVGVHLVRGLHDDKPALKCNEIMESANKH